MPALSLRYDHCALRKPRYLKKSAIKRALKVEVRTSVVMV